MNNPTDFNDFKEFYENEFIKSIAGNEKWTVSDNKKVPLNMRELIDNHKVYGANFEYGNPCVTLDELLATLPTAANHAYYLDCAIDNFVVLDIEPKCPDNIKQQLLKLPYIYGEISMSGNGYHLVFPLPDSFSAYPIAQKKLALKEEHGYYEILLNHFVTFTRNMIQPSNNTGNFIAIFNKLASEAKETKRIDIELEKIQPQNIPMQDEIINILKRQLYTKTLADFFGDHSKYEYAYIGFLYYKLTCLLNVTALKEKHEYTANERVWLLYMVADLVIPKRAKTEETRNGMPWLLYLSQEVIAKHKHSTKE